jgi:hypothetical protein
LTVAAALAAIAFAGTGGDDTYRIAVRIAEAGPRPAGSGRERSAHLEMRTTFEPAGCAWRFRDSPSRVTAARAT